MLFGQFDFFILELGRKGRFTVNFYVKLSFCGGLSIDLRYCIFKMEVILSLKSKHFLFTEALSKRVLLNDLEANAIQQEFYRMEAGLSGELKLKQTLSDYFFKTDHHILYNFECINEKGFSHQMDAILITPFFIVIFEVKQLSGTLFYKSSQHEFSRIHNDKHENFRSPIDQVYRHQLFLEQCLRQWQINIPIYYAVVIANVQARLDESLSNFPIFHISGVPSFIENLYRTTSKSNANLNVIVAKLNQLAVSLPPRRSVEITRLRQGVLCQNCNFENTMHYYYGQFICPICKAKSRYALFETLHHYRVLVGEKISNQQFRAFFGIESIQTASNILSRLGLERHGAKKGTYYIIPEDILAWSKKQKGKR